MSNTFDKWYSVSEITQNIKDIQSFINRKDFSIKDDMIIITKSKNLNFMLQEDLNDEDIVEVIRLLSSQDYIKSVLDDKHMEPLYLHEFAVVYNNIKYVYIKLKYDEKNKKIRIVSFHKNEYDIVFKYK